MPSNRNVTYIDDLLDLDDIENSGVTKHIRGSHAVPDQAGMRPYGPVPPHGPHHGAPHGMHHGVPHGVPHDISHSQGPHGQVKHIPMPANSPSCLDVAAHIMNCPICSKFYNTDKTLYIIAIVFLLVVCIILLKRIMNV